MWKCPNCPAIHQNPEIHWKHLQENPKCMEKTKNPGWKGWQGLALDGVPTIVYTPHDNVDPSLWWKPKSSEEQAEFAKRWAVSVAAEKSDEKLPKK